MRVLVTGASGYLGPHVVKALASLGHDVIGVSRSLAPIEQDLNISVIQGDVLNAGFDISKIAGGFPDAIVHLAWEDGFWHDSTSHITNLSSHFRFLVECAEKGVGNITVLGTVHEIGYWDGEVSADTPCNPISLYGIAKDTLRRSLARALPSSCLLKWVRAFYITGDDARNNSVFSKILESASEGKRSFPFTDGKNEYDFIHVTELASQISKVAAYVGKDKHSPVIVNCSSGSPVPIGQKAEEFIIQNDLEIELQYGFYPSRAYDSPRIWGETRTFQELTENMG